MMNKNILCTILIAFVVSTASFAQLQVGQGINDFYYKVPEIHNLALLPNHSVPAVMITAGSRMDGFGRHPFTGSLLCSGYLIDRLGGAVKVNYDRAGLLTKLDAQVGLSYYVFLTKDHSNAEGKHLKGDKFSFFLAGHFTQDIIDRNDIVVLDSDDPALENVSDVAPGGNASAGIAFLREDTYYAGFSVYQLIEHETDYLSTVWTNRQRRQYFLTGAYTFHFEKKVPIDLELHAIATMNDFQTAQIIGGVDLTLMKILGLGLDYRSNGSLKFNLGVKAQTWDFGYACSYGAWVDATAYTYKGFANSVFIRKTFNEGRRSAQ
jgi:type IX secretion system PorP/SprF family membrane protein